MKRRQLSCLFLSIYLLIALVVYAASDPVGAVEKSEIVVA